MEEGRGVAEGGESRLEGCSPRPRAPRARLRARRCPGGDRSPNLAQRTVHYFINTLQDRVINHWACSWRFYTSCVLLLKAERVVLGRQTFKVTLTTTEAPPWTPQGSTCPSKPAPQPRSSNSS